MSERALEPSPPAGILPADHPERAALAREVHARPPDAIETPARVTHVALLVAPDERAREAAHLQALCAGHGVEPPAGGVGQYAVALGTLKLKWERHGEFSGYTFSSTDAGPAPFVDPPVARLPAGWLAATPGRVIMAAHAEVVRAPENDAGGASLAARFFDGHTIVGSDVGQGAGAAYSDFQVRDDGFTRFLLVDRSFTPRQTGRMLQRLFEIETYRMLALLTLPIARQAFEALGSVEATLAALTDDIAGARSDDEALLHQVTRLAADVEHRLAAGQFRFSACAAYAELVELRIAELRERRLEGVQPIGEFMARRFTPAVHTCLGVAQRLQRLSERVSRAGALLATRVDISRERQNQALLASMDRRARLQLRLQQTVEGLSVAAIVYYGGGVVAYLAKSLKAAGVPIDPDLTVGAALPLIALLVIGVMRRAHRAPRDRAGGDF